ncbi:MAG: NADH-quinone oxidoreductase subunit H [Candidatus Marinimicrobia bacterium]|nr:NADH-quinone oxidoreductase subunit H [Candidatus Neomarinimicrobiota bacterium]
MIETISILFFAISAFIIIFIIATLAASFNRRLLSHSPNQINKTGINKQGIIRLITNFVQTSTKKNISESVPYKKYFTFILIIIFSSIFSIFAIIPFSNNICAIKLDTGLLFILAVLSINIIGIIILGLTSTDSINLYNSIKSIVQLMTCQITLTITMLIIAIISGSLNMEEIINNQTGYYFRFLPKWFLFHSPFTLAGFLTYFVSTVVIMRILNAGSTPFKENILQNFNSELTIFQQKIFHITKYTVILILLFLNVITYLGGWLSPFDGINLMTGSLWEFFWMLFKTALLFFLVIWLNSSIPDLSGEQIFRINYKFLFPMALISFIGTGLLVII